MADLTISAAGAHASVEDTDRIPASKGGVSGYHTIAALRAEFVGGGGGSSAAEDITIVDAGGLFTATNVEAALAETATALNTAEAAIDAIEADYLTSTSVGVTVQAYDAQLDTWSGVTPSVNGQSLVSAADYAAMRALLDLEAGTDFYSIAAADAAFLTPAEGNAAYQPLDADLTSIAALATTAAGRSALTIADPNADRILAWDDTAGSVAAIALADIATEAAPAAGDYLLAYGAEGDLRKVDWSSLPGAGGGISNIVEDATPQLGGNLDLNGFAITGLVIGTDVQAFDADLSSWAGVTRAAGFDTFAATPSSTNLASLVTGETGTGALVFATSPTLVTPALGTPASGTLTNCTGLPAAGLVTSTTQAVGFGSINLGHATDTTIARSSAGNISVEGNVVYRAGGTDVPVADGGTGASDAATARTNLGLVIGTNVQAWDAQLDSLSAATANGVSLVTAANYAAMRTLLDLEAGTDFYSIAAADAAFQPIDADTLKADTADVLTAGFAATPFSAGTKSTGTFTPDETSGNFQYATNGGAHTLAPPTNSGSLVLLYANNASAGTITTSGFTMVTGDDFTTTNGHEFMLYVTKHNNGVGFSHLHVVALQ